MLFNSKKYEFLELRDPKNNHDIQFISTPPFGLKFPCKACRPPEVYLRKDFYDEYVPPNKRGSKKIYKYTWHNRNQITVSVINYGASIISMKIPDHKGEIVDIVMGYDKLDDYINENNPSFGALLGRVANKIYQGDFCLDEKIIHLQKNLDDKHFTDGGFSGFDKVVWDTHEEDKKVIMSYTSPDGEGNFPGSVIVAVSFELTEDNQFIIDIRAVTTKSTPLNLTFNNYFNLAGHSAGEAEIQQHDITINADSFVVTNNEGFATGQIKSVAKKVIDLQTAKKIGDLMPVTLKNGFDHNYCLSRKRGQRLTFAVRLVHPYSGRVLEMYTNQPGVYFHTANDLPVPLPVKISYSKIKYENNVCCERDSYPCPKLGFDCMNSACNPQDPDTVCCKIGDEPCAKLGFECNIGGEPCQPLDKSPCCEVGAYPCPKMGFDCNLGDPCIGTPFPLDLNTGPIKGKECKYYHQHGAVCINSQNHPDAVNHSNFPKCILNPGEIYKHKIVYKFYLLKHPLEPKKKR